MTDQRIAPPPAALLGSGTAAPEARTVISEVRSDSSLPFDPSAPPFFLNRGALIQWQVDLSWSQAQQIQLWLIGAPAGGWGHFPSREAALRDFFENLQAGTPPAPLLEYDGTFLTTGLSHARYTMVLGMKVPTTRDVYQDTFNKALNDLLAGAESAGWAAELVSFLKMMLNQPSSREDFLTLAANIGDLAAPRQPPLIKTLIT
jgi:hypothetical protein